MQFGLGYTKVDGEHEYTLIVGLRKNVHSFKIHSTALKYLIFIFFLFPFSPSICISQYKHASVATFVFCTCVRPPAYFVFFAVDENVKHLPRPHSSCSRKFAKNFPLMFFVNLIRTLNENTENASLVKLATFGPLGIHDRYVEKTIVSRRERAQTSLWSPIIIIFFSGVGDGSYPSYWRLDNQREVCELVTDF